MCQKNFQFSKAIDIREIRAEIYQIAIYSQPIDYENERIGQVGLFRLLGEGTRDGMGLCEIESARVLGGCSGWRPGRQAQVFKDLDHGWWGFDGGDDLEITVTVGADLYVHAKHAL